MEPDIIYGVVIVNHYNLQFNEPAFDINRVFNLNRLMFRTNMNNNGYFNTPLLF